MERANTESEAKNVERNKGKCYYCGRDRHPDNGHGWRKMCPAKNSECRDCKQTGHFNNTPACKLNYKKVSCIKIEAINSTKSTNMVKATGKFHEKLHQPHDLPVFSPNIGERQMHFGSPKFQIGGALAPPGSPLCAPLPPNQSYGQGGRNVEMVSSQEESAELDETI